MDDIEDGFDSYHIYNLGRACGMVDMCLNIINVLENKLDKIDSEFFDCLEGMFSHYFEHLHPYIINLSKELDDEY